MERPGRGIKKNGIFRTIKFRARQIVEWKMVELEYYYRYFNLTVHMGSHFTETISHMCSYFTETIFYGS